jgi:hypothetical protein
LWLDILSEVELKGFLTRRTSYAPYEGVTAFIWGITMNEMQTHPYRISAGGSITPGRGGWFICPRLKILLREKARALRLPVLMETSDRGMLDVERFDLEPDRPILYGKVGWIWSADMDRLTGPTLM